MISMENIDLFAAAAEAENSRFEPLAERMRPRNFDEFVGQQSVLGKGRFLRRMIEEDRIPSMILYGPPGTGKTTLAQMIAGLTNSRFQKLNAVASGIADIRTMVKEACEARRYYQKRTIIFIDEIHRFNKGQQDALLSRVRIIQLKMLSDGEIVRVLKIALADKERGLGKEELETSDDVLLGIAQMAGGDARIALNLMEGMAAMLPQDVPKEERVLTLDLMEDIVGERVQRYDKKGDNHYDTVSAFIKSMRGSDPDAALHYLARMLASGEDLNFIARRIVICAAEDVGNADPRALVIAMAAAHAVQFLGMPEARIPLAEAVTYIAGAPKSNAAYLGIDAALADVRSRNCGSVPLNLRDAHYKGATKLGHGVKYRYAHDFPNHFIKQQYLPEKLKGTRYYAPTENGEEKSIRAYLKRCWPDRYGEV